MATKINFLSDEDLKILQSIIDREKKLLRNVPNRPPFPQENISQAADSYIVQVIEPNGLLPGATLTCPVYKKLRSSGVDSLNYAGFTIDVYNPSKTIIPLNAIFLASKDKYSTWVPTISGMSNALLVNPNSGITLQEDERGTGSGTGTGGATYPRQFPNTTTLIVDGASGFELTQLSPGVVLLSEIDTGGGTGTVTSVSVVTANGVSGTVANPTTTPAITLLVQDASGSQSGLVNTTGQTFAGAKTFSTITATTANIGTANITVANVSNKAMFAQDAFGRLDIFGVGGLGILRLYDASNILRVTAALEPASVTTDVAFLLAAHDASTNPVNASYGVVDSSSNGWVGAWTTVSGLVFKGGLYISGSLSVSAGSVTGLSAIATSGLWSDLSGTPTTLSGYGITSPLNISQGGTARASLTANNLLVGNGTSAVNFVAPNTAGYVLTDNGAGNNPSFQAPSSGMAIGGGVSGGTATRILFEGAGPVLADSPALLWNYTVQQLYAQTTLGNTAIVGADSTNALQGTLGADNYAVGGFSGSYIGYLGTTGMLGNAAGTFQDASSTVTICNGTDALDVKGGPLHLEHHLSSTQPSSPTIVANGAAGTGASASIVGTDTAGQITLNTGTLGLSSGSLLTTTFAITFVNGTTVQITAANANAAAASPLIYTNDLAATFDILATTGLSIAQTYIWNYQVIGN